MLSEVLHLFNKVELRVLALFIGHERKESVESIKLH